MQFETISNPCVEATNRSMCPQMWVQAVTTCFCHLIGVPTSSEMCTHVNVLIVCGYALNECTPVGTSKLCRITPLFALPIVASPNQSRNVYVMNTYLSHLQLKRRSDEQLLHETHNCIYRDKHFDLVINRDKHFVAVINRDKHC